jgi:DNA-binding MarR family transcriptional regulator
MPKRPPLNLPIGYWLKRADNLITEHINRVQAANGVSRFEWQVLNLLLETGEASRERLFETMRTFVDASGLDTILDRIIENGWVKQDEDAQGAANFQLTEDGRRHHGSFWQRRSRREKG